jgi:hypothetical protein
MVIVLRYRLGFGTSTSQTTGGPADPTSYPDFFPADRVDPLDVADNRATTVRQHGVRILVVVAIRHRSKWGEM